MIIRNLLLAGFILLGLTACSDDDNWKEPDNPIPPEQGDVKGVYILNEGSMGGNNSTLSYFNYESGTFTNDYFSDVNPSQGGLGDTGNDIQIYGSKMYAVINGSNYVEVMDAKTAKHIGKITITNGRSITFDKGFVYVSSFAGPIQPNNSQLGTVIKIDTASLQIVNRATVGYQPEEMVIVNNKLYVANSGGYTSESYDTTVSVIDLNSFTETKKIQVGPNLWRVRADKNNQLWITSRGNYADITPFLAVIDPNTDTVAKTLNLTVTNFDFYGNNLYYYGVDYDSSYHPINSYGIIDITTQSKTSSHFINGDTESQLTAPYGIKINPDNGDIFIADAMDYISPGKVYCLNKSGNLKWVKTAGLSPGHFALLTK